MQDLFDSAGTNFAKYAPLNDKHQIFTGCDYQYADLEGLSWEQFCHYNNGGGASLKVFTFIGGYILSKWLRHPTYDIFCCITGICEIHVKEHIKSSESVSDAQISL
jgi:hypothetical protein